MSEAEASRVGSMFGSYHLKRLLGRGGMGEVYEAEHTVKERTVAVKLMSDTFSKDPAFCERMKREARIAGRLQEPHVVPIYDYGEIDGRLFLEMRLIEGTDLDRLLKRDGPLAPPRAVPIITQIASALDAAHAAEVMHRDVKPRNILVTRDDFAYLVDFGLSSVTFDGIPVYAGAWRYVAPERFSNGDVTRRSTVVDAHARPFALGSPSRCTPPVAGVGSCSRQCANRWAPRRVSLPRACRKCVAAFSRAAAFWAASVVKRSPNWPLLNPLLALRSEDNAAAPSNQRRPFTPGQSSSTLLSRLRPDCHLGAVPGITLIGPERWGIAQAVYDRPDIRIGVLDLGIAVAAGGSSKPTQRR
jgi:serine/threonine protein kinase